MGRGDSSQFSCSTNFSFISYKCPSPKQRTMAELEAGVVPDLSDIQLLEEKHKNLNTTTLTMQGNMDNFFLIVMGCIVFLMQAGFAFLEAGAVRSKNTVNILIKNMLDALIGGLTYWMIGWGAAYGKGGNGFIGGSNYFSYNMDAMDYPAWFF